MLKKKQGQAACCMVSVCLLDVDILFKAVCCSSLILLHREGCTKMMRLNVKIKQTPMESKFYAFQRFQIRGILPAAIPSVTLFVAPSKSTSTFADTVAVCRGAIFDFVLLFKTGGARLWLGQRAQGRGELHRFLSFPAEPDGNRCVQQCKTRAAGRVPQHALRLPHSLVYPTHRR